MAVFLYPSSTHTKQRLISRRHIFAVAAFGLIPKASTAQMSQRARQIRERRACEDNLPTCRPEIRTQLDEEQQRLRIGLGGLALGALGLGLVIWRYHLSRQASEEKQIEHLNQRLSDIGGKSRENQAKSSGDDSSNL